MKNGAKIAIIVILGVAVVVTFALRGSKRDEYVATPAPAEAMVVSSQKAVAVAVLAKPRLLELGSMRCQSCLEMAKVLEALRASQGAKLQVDFIDVFEQPEAADPYKISLIPTQILYNGAGKEIFRHTGYFSHDDILAKFRALDVKL